jgi:MtrB/PioB family decaheme-associated outer membrane protein
LAQGEFELEEVPAEEKPAPFYSGFAEAGGLYNSADSFRHGRYSGLTDEQGYVIGNFGLLYRAPWDGDGAEFIRASGENLGLDSRSLGIAGGWQGHLKGFFAYDEVPYFHFEGRTPYLGVGGDALVLPTPWVPAATAPGLTALKPNLKPVDIKTERDRFGGGLTWDFSPGWSVGGKVRHEEKTGLRNLGVAWGTTGGNPLTIIVPETVDYRTDTADVNLNYAGGPLQFQAGYQLSAFNNRTDKQRVQSPFINAGTPGTFGDYPTFATMQLAPDNTAHQATLAAGYDFGAHTRLVANLGYGVNFQDDPFLPYSSDPTVVITTPLPRDSLDGRVNTALANAQLTTRPVDDVDLGLRYRFTDRDNDTPRNLYIYVAADSENQQGIASARARFNHPYSFREHLASLDAGYRLTNDTKIVAGYDFRVTERDFSEVAANNEHTGRIQARSTLAEGLSGSLKYARSWRDGETYIGNAPFLEGHSPQHLATPLTFRFENHPLLRKFYEADRVRDAGRATLEYSPNAQWTLGVTGSVTYDDYDATEIGLKRFLGSSVSFDVAYAPIDAISAHAFYTFERSGGDQAGWSFTSAPATVTNPDRRWWVSTRDVSHSVGIGGNWQATAKLGFGADYTFIRSVTDFAISAGPALAIAPLADVPTSIHNIGINAAYDLTDRVTVGLGYAVERYRTSDFALDIGINELNRVVTLGELDPDYTAHVGAAGLKFKY